MVVGVLEITLRLFETDSLKSKRKIVKGAIDRVQHRFHVAVAEVRYNDDHTRAGLGVAAVSNDRSHANSVLDKVRAAIEDYTVGSAEILEERLELLQF